MSGKVRICDVAYFSAEHKINTVNGLVNGKTKWTSPATQPKPNHIEAELCLASPTVITGLDVGNFWSASVEVYVGKNEWPQSKRELLFPEHIFMNRMTCFSGENKNTMMFFREKHFRLEVSKQKWDRVKVVCNQPFKFNNDVFGLSVLTIHGLQEGGKTDKENVSLASSSPSSGLAAFKQKLDRASDKAKETPKFNSTLQSLENSTRLNSEARESGARVDKAAMSRSAKLVATSLGPSSKAGVGKDGETVKEVKDPLKEECIRFINECAFDKMTFAEIEMVTFRTVKELWQTKKKTEMTKEQKDCLKPLSVKYLNRLVSKTQKRALEEPASVGQDGAKKRKVSDRVMEMRRNDDIIDEVNEGGSMRNKIATMDRNKNSNEGKPTTANIFKCKPPSENIQRNKVDSWLSKTESKSNSKDESKIPEKKKKDSAVFDLNLPSTIPVEVIDIEDENPPPKKKISRPPSGPVYNRKRLLEFTQTALVKAGILVQVYNYKKPKDLPMKGGKMLSVKKGVPVTFYKVGPDIHLEVEGKFHMPDVLPEHMERVFKNFVPERVRDDKYPRGLEEFLKGNKGLKEEKNILRFPITDSSPSNKSPRKRKVSQSSKDCLNSPKKVSAFPVDLPDSPNKSPQSRSCSPSTICPLCSLSFPQDDLPEHAASCQGASEMDQGRVVDCPICGNSIDQDRLEDHADVCAASKFGL